MFLSIKNQLRQCTEFSHLKEEKGNWEMPLPQRSLLF